MLTNLDRKSLDLHASADGTPATFNHNIYDRLSRDSCLIGEMHKPTSENDLIDSDKAAAAARMRAGNDSKLPINSNFVRREENCSALIAAAV